MFGRRKEVPCTMQTRDARILADVRGFVHSAKQSTEVNRHIMVLSPGQFVPSVGLKHFFNTGDNYHSFSRGLVNVFLETSVLPDAG
jgi:hypothetical protein